MIVSGNSADDPSRNMEISKTMGSDRLIAIRTRQWPTTPVWTPSSFSVFVITFDLDHPSRIVVFITCL
jgi:hypothetical protein